MSSLPLVSALTPEDQFDSSLTKALTLFEQLRDLRSSLLQVATMVTDTLLAGVSAYNHNIDTSPEYYPQIISTRTFEDRLKTIRALQQAEISVCSGGIIGMGESITDRLRMIEVLCNLDPVPESVPINALVPMPGTPLEHQPPVDIFEFVRLIATTRIAMPRARVRLSAGRNKLSREGQALCFFAGANSIHCGEKLLTADNPQMQEDMELLSQLGLLQEQEACSHQKDA